MEEKEWQERGNYRKRVLALEGEVLVQIVQVPRGRAVGEHYHLRQKEFYYILKGEAVLKIGEEEHLAKPGDSFICSAGQKHSVDNSSGREDFELLVVKLDYHGEDSVWL